MGTSASSNGPGSGVSLDPEWLDDIGIPNIDQESDGNMNSDVIIAPRARFSNARRNLGEFVRSGDRDSLRRSLGHYSGTGMGGSRKLAQRMRVSTSIAEGMVHTFRALRDDANFELRSVISKLKEQGANATQIIAAFVSHVCPDGGSLDEISSRNSGTAALSEFLDRNPEADIVNLSDDQIWSLTSSFLANEVFNRIQMDIGQAFEMQDLPFPDRISRMNEMKVFIRVEIATQLNDIRSKDIQNADISKLLQQTIQNTFEIYEVEV